MKLHSYLLVDWTNVIVARCQARDIAHATEKFTAFGHSFNAAYVVSHADYTAERDLVLEQTGQAPWQKQLTRNTPKSAFGI